MAGDREGRASRPTAMNEEEGWREAEQGLGWPVVERGSGRPVVFLHGYPLNHSMWEPQLDELASDCRVILFDLPGYGTAEEWPVPNSLSGFARTVYRTLVTQLPTPAVVVGHSFGGYVLLAIFEKHPELFEGIVLTNTRSNPDSPEARTKRLTTARRLERPAETLDVEEVSRSLLAPATWESGGPAPAKVREMIRQAHAPAVIGTLRAIAYRPDLTPILARIEVPTLVVWGEEDRLIPPPESWSMLAHLRRGRGQGIPGAGHLPSLEAPSEFARAIRDFLGRLPPASGT